MEFICIRCNSEFDAANPRGYCDACVAHFAEVRSGIHRRQRPAPGVICDGKFSEDCPQTVTDPITQKLLCGLCGSDEVEMGYGLGSGYGMGSYQFQQNCNSFLDFHEETE